MENLRELIRDIDKHMRAEWYAGRLPAETWPKSLSDRLAAAVSALAATPAALAVPMAEVWEQSAADTEHQSTGAGLDFNQGVAEGMRICAKDLRAALAATPAAGAPVVPKWIDDPHDIEQGQMLNPEWVKEQEAAVMVFLPFSARTAIAKRDGMKVTAEFNALVREVIAEYRVRTVPSGIAAAAPVVLPEQDAVLLNQGVELLHALSNDERNRGNCSSAEGATASAYAVQRLAALLATGGQAQAVDIAELVTGMSVSVDVSTCDDDAGNRYFGTVTVAQEDPHDKHGLTLLVQDAKPNFAPQAQADARDVEIQQAVLAERERICAAIKAEDDHCVTEGDYMLDSDDCIKVARGEWVRPVYDAAIAAAKRST